MTDAPTGWICPRCRASCAPSVATCPLCLPPPQWRLPDVPTSATLASGDAPLAGAPAVAWSTWCAGGADPARLERSP